MNEFLNTVATYFSDSESGSGGGGGGPTAPGGNTPKKTTETLTNILIDLRKNKPIVSTGNEGLLTSRNIIQQAISKDLLLEKHALGGMSGYTGFHWLEQGERVLTPPQNKLLESLVRSMEIMSRAHVSLPYVNPQ